MKMGGGGGGVVIESEIWIPNQGIYIFIIVSCIVSVFGVSHFNYKNNNYSSGSLDHKHQSLPFSLRTFLLLFSISSVMQGLGPVAGDYSYSSSSSAGIFSKEHLALCISLGYASSLFLAPLAGILSDFVGQKPVCLAFYVIHLFVAMYNKIASHPNVCVSTICLALASSIFSFTFETFLVLEHDKLGYRQDMLNEMFWLMTFSMSASFIGSQVLANWLVGRAVQKSVASLSSGTFLLAGIGIISVMRGWKESPKVRVFKDYRASFYTYVLGDKRIWLLVWAQACVNFSVAVFWILWAPTIVADGREVHLGLMYPCFMGAGMLGSTAFPWFVNGPVSLRVEDCLLYVFSIAGIVLCVVAYDYQEIGVLVTLFCLLHACIGLTLPSLARLRTLYVPNELRGGMISLSLAPANLALVFFLLQRGYYQNIENSTIMAFAALSLLSAAGCMHLLKKWGKQLHNDWHKM